MVLSAPRWPFGLIAALAGAAAALLGWQHLETVRLRANLVHRRHEAQERKELLTENRRLLAGQLPVAELNRLRSERAALAALRTELDGIRHRAEATAARATAASAREARPRVGATEPPLTQGLVAAGEWRDAGTATPEAVVETALWAAAGGDVEALAALLILPPETRGRAAAVFAQLPGPVQAELGTPERLVAFMTAKDVPLGQAQISSAFPEPKVTLLTVQLVDQDGKARSVMLTSRLDGDHWRLAVPVAAIERYAAWLGLPAPATGGGR